MHFIPYNSRKKYHLSPGAAVRSGEKMTFRIVLPRSEQCSAVRLVLEPDCGGREDISFSWERMQGEDEEWWRLETAAPEKRALSATILNMTLRGVRGRYLLKAAASP